MSVGSALVSLSFAAASCGGADPTVEDSAWQAGSGEERADVQEGVATSELLDGDGDQAVTADSLKSSGKWRPRPGKWGWGHGKWGWGHGKWWWGHGTGGSGGGGGTSGTGGTSGAGATSGTGGTPSTGGSGGDLLTGVETPTPPCTVAPLPEYAALPTNDRLPDPFALMNGSEVASMEDWACRRAEIMAELVEYELGPKPPKPSSVTGSLSGDTLTIEASEGDRSMSFTATISKPSGEGPFPAIIVYSTACVPIPPGVATITLNVSPIAADSTRGVGGFYDLYGSDHPAGVFMAWAWGVSRIIDALEVTPAAGIDPQRLGVTGCSRFGKAALVAGAFDARIALTLPQESGSGGSGCWRVADAQAASGAIVQTLASAVSEAAWFRSSFSQFSDNANRLPFDHHMLEGLIAPRALLVIDNTAYSWLGDESCYTCGVAARRIWDALGVSDSMGYSQVSHGDHCRFPSEQQPELTAFIDRFLLDGTGDTDVLITDGSYTFDEARWVDWNTPAIQ